MQNDECRMRNQESRDGGASFAPPSSILHSSFCILHFPAAFPGSFDLVHVQHPPSPKQGFLVGGEVDVELVALDGAAAVDHFDSAGAVVAGDLEPRAEPEESGVGGDEFPGVVA